MNARTPLTNILDESIITHEYTADGHLLINLFFYVNGEFLAKMLYFPETQHFAVDLANKNDFNLFNYVMQNVDLCLSWMKAFEKGMNNQQMEPRRSFVFIRAPQCS